MLFARWIRHRKQPATRSTFAVRRIVDGWWWCGPYRWQGRTFSQHTRLRYRVGTRSAAEAAMENLWNPLVKCEVVELDSGSLRQPSKAPPT